MRYESSTASVARNDGRAAIVYFLEGFSLKEARRIYLRSRKKGARPQLIESGAQSGRPTRA